MPKNAYSLGFFAKKGKNMDLLKYGMGLISNNIGTVYWEYKKGQIVERAADRTTTLVENITQQTTDRAINLVERNVDQTMQGLREGIFTWHRSLYNISMTAGLIGLKYLASALQTVDAEACSQEWLSFNCISQKSFDTLLILAILRSTWITMNNISDENNWQRGVVLRNNRRVILPLQQNNIEDIALNVLYGINRQNDGQNAYWQEGANAPQQHPRIRQRTAGEVALHLLYGTNGQGNYWREQ